MNLDNSKALFRIDAEGRLYSEQYQDIYYASDKAIEESFYVFLTGNLMPERWIWQELDAQFLVAETGFGTGLNFWNLCDLWLKTPEVQKSELHFYSVEKHPIPEKILTQVLEQWPQFKPLYSVLLKNWESGIEQGFLDLEICPKVFLHIQFCDIQKWLPLLPSEINAWFLDGFSPDKNSEMWCEELFKTIEQKTVLQGTFATFTSAGFIKRALWRAGFEVLRTLGYGQKNHRLQGIWHGDFNEKRYLNSLNKALWNACVQADLELIEEYLEEGADPLFLDSKGRDLSYYAILGNHCQIFELILAKHSELNWDWNEIRKSLVHLGKTQAFKGLYENGRIASLEKDPELLVFAAEHGWNELVRLMLELGWSANSIETYYGESALFRACSKGHIEVIQSLIEFGCDVNAVSKFGNGAIHISARHALVDVIRILVSAGANILLADRKGKTALDWALDREHTDLINYLKSLTADT